VSLLLPACIPYYYVTFVQCITCISACGGPGREDPLISCVILSKFTSVEDLSVRLDKPCESNVDKLEAWYYSVIRYNINRWYYIWERLISSYYCIFFVRFPKCKYAHTDVCQLFGKRLIVDWQKLFAPLEIVISIIGIELQFHSVYFNFHVNVHIRTYISRNSKDFLIICMKQIWIASALYIYNQALGYFSAI